MKVTVDDKGISARERRIVGRFVRAAFLRNRRAGPFLVPDWLRHEKIRFAGNTGADLAGRWFSAPKACGTVVLAHPDRRYGQHWFVASGWVDFLHAHDYNALTFDFPDYGESRGGSTYYHEDVLAATRTARNLAPDGPLHVVGVSMGAFAAANASPEFEDVDALILESVYPSFRAWYGRRPAAFGMILFDALFPKTGRRILAKPNIARTKADRILIAGSNADPVTPIHLTQAVARAAPADRTRFLELAGVAHLDLFSSSETYRQAILTTLEGGRASSVRPVASAPMDVRRANGHKPLDAAKPAGRSTIRLRRGA